MGTPSFIHVTSGKGAEFTPHGMTRDTLERRVELVGCSIMLGSSGIMKF